MPPIDLLTNSLRDDNLAALQRSRRPSRVHHRPRAGQIVGLASTSPESGARRALPSHSSRDCAR